jgi:hypothetical protein
MFIKHRQEVSRYGVMILNKLKILTNSMLAIKC